LICSPRCPIMSVPDAIAEIWRTYQVTLDCLEVALLEKKRGRIDSLQGTGFMDMPIDVVRRDIQTSRDVVNDHAILSMWTVFEREMVAVLESESRKMLDTPSSAFNQAICRKVEAGIEYWRVSEMIDLFKPLLAIELIGYMKQIKRYRDWVAHKNPKKAPPAKVTPEFTYEVLVLALEQMGAVSQAIAG